MAGSGDRYVNVGASFAGSRREEDGLDRVEGWSLRPKETQVVCKAGQKVVKKCITACNATRGGPFDGGALPRACTATI